MANESAPKSLQELPTWDLVARCQEGKLTIQQINRLPVDDAKKYSCLLAVCDARVLPGRGSGWALP